LTPSVLNVAFKIQFGEMNMSFEHHACSHVDIMSRTDGISATKKKKMSELEIWRACLPCLLCFYSFLLLMNEKKNLDIRHPSINDAQWKDL